MFFPSQQQPTPCQFDITNTEDNSPGTEDNSPGIEVTPASDSNETSVIIGSVLGSLAVLILSAILALLLILILKKKRRHRYTIQGIPYITV